MVFRGAVHFRQWLILGIVIAFVIYAFLYLDSFNKGILVVAPLLLSLQLIGKYRAKITIDNGIVTIRQYDNHHEFNVENIRRIERIEYSGWKKLMFPVDGIHIFYNNVSDAIFYPKDVDALEAALKEAAQKVK